MISIRSAKHCLSRTCLFLPLLLVACGGGQEPLGSGDTATLGEIAPRPLAGTPEAIGHPTDSATEVAAVDLDASERELRERELEIWQQELEAREAALQARERRAEIGRVVSRPQPAPRREAAPAPAPRYEPTPVYEPAPAPVEPAAEPRPAPRERWSEPAPRPVRSRSITLPAAQPLEVELLDGASSATSQAGDPVSARLARGVYHGGELAIPAGSRVYGRVTEARSLRRIGGKARLAVAFEEVELPNGALVPILATWVAEGRGETKRDAATIAGSTAGGAVLGQVLKGDREATAIGAVVGAAIGTAVAAKTRGQDVELPAGSTLEITLDQPATVDGL